MSSAKNYTIKALLSVAVIAIALTIFILKFYARSNSEIVDSFRGINPGGLRHTILTDLAISRGEEIVPELIEASYQDDPKYRSSLIRVLGSIGGDLAVARLVELAVAGDDLEGNLWTAISFSQDPRFIPILEEKLKENLTERERGNVLITLAEIGGRGQLRELLEYMKKTELRGHFYRSNRAFEDIADKQFNKDVSQIESWLERNLGEPRR